MGSFATKFVLVFGTQLIISLGMVIGGWLSMPSKQKADESLMWGTTVDMVD